MSDALSEHQLLIAKRVLDEEARKREHLVVHLSGAHAYGFASENSDIDLKAIHIAPTQRVLGLGKLRTSVDRLEVLEEVEIDYTSNELIVAIRGLLQGDGNMLERILSQEPLRSHPFLDELVEITKKSISKKFYNHYRGFATSQRRSLESSSTPVAKKALYVLRTTLTGVHLLESGECLPDLASLAPKYGFEAALPLIELKRENERTPLTDEMLKTLPSLLDRAFKRLDEAHEGSELPAAAETADELESWLISVRRRMMEKI